VESLFCVASGLEVPSGAATDAVIPGCVDADVSAFIDRDLVISSTVTDVTVSPCVLKDVDTSSYAAAVASLVSSAIYAPI